MTVYSSIAGLYTNFVDGRVYDDLSGQYYSMGYLITIWATRTTNGIVILATQVLIIKLQNDSESLNIMGHGQPTFGAGQQHLIISFFWIYMYRV